MITEEELVGLQDWLASHEHLRSCWPYDEVDSPVISVMSDGRISAEEQKLLRSFFSEFIAMRDERVIAQPLVELAGSVVGLCAACPEISFQSTKFCLTGASSRLTRAGFMDVVRNLGAEPVNSVTKTLNDLVIGADGNPCWFYACYGRKVEKAVELRRSGAKIVLVHENDFHDAVADAKLC